MKAIALAAGSLGAAVLFVPAAAQAQDLPQCRGYPVAEATYSCRCPPDPRRGAVWGSGPYTADSDLCTAAIHAGMIGTGGGAIMAIRIDGMADYQGSERNGVATSRWSRADHSVMFAPAQAGGGQAGGTIVTPPPAPPQPQPAPPAFGGTSVAPPAFGLPSLFPQAPATPPSVPGTVTAPVTAVPAGPACSALGPDVETRCTCPPNAPAGPVWGAGPYTSDSDLCTAARHAGAIGLAGGEISVIRLPGLTSYKAVERNGILTMDWGDYGESFIVNINNN